MVNPDSSSTLKRNREDSSGKEIVPYRPPPYFLRPVHPEYAGRHTNNVLDEEFRMLGERLGVAETMVIKLNTHVFSEQLKMVFQFSSAGGGNTGGLPF